MRLKSKRLAILIPCHNEELGIEKVITSVPVKQLKRLGYNSQIIVIDNNCTDKTVAIARKLHATVVTETKKGKGNAIMAGFKAIKKNIDYVVMLDGDNTYKGSEIPRLVEPLESGFCDVVVGSRLGGKMSDKALKFSNRVANWIYTFLVRQIYRANVTDVLSGFFAWRREVTDSLTDHIESRGFSIEMDMITKSVKLGYSLCSVPITYDIREGESKVQALEDGLRIMAVLVLNFIWVPHIDLSKRTRLVGMVKAPLVKLNHTMVTISTYMMF